MARVVIALYTETVYDLCLCPLLDPGVAVGRRADNFSAAGLPNNARAQSEKAFMAKRYKTGFVMFVVTVASKHVASRKMATMLNHSSIGGIGGERDVHDMTVGFHNMTMGAAKEEAPAAEQSQRLGERHGSKHPTRRTKVKKILCPRSLPRYLFSYYNCTGLHV